MPTDTSPNTRHNIDRRAGKLASELADGDPDQLDSTTDLSELLGISPEWLEIGRNRGYGPPFVVLSPKRIRYKRSDVVAWLRERTYNRTSQYEHQSTGRAAGCRVVDGKVIRAEPQIRGEAKNARNTEC
jgi:hypothetical protein